MHVNELRIGQYILIGKTDVPSFDDIQYDEIKVTPQGMKLIFSEPLLYVLKEIPVTESWLNKLGFDYGEFGKRYWNNGIVMRSPCKKYKYANKKLYLTFDEDGFGDFKVVCPNVHQLQNLYFALTGQQLEAAH